MSVHGWDLKGWLQSTAADTLGQENSKPLGSEAVKEWLEFTL